MSSSTGALREKRDEILNVEWQIDDFLSLSGSPGSFNDSPTFRFSDCHWNLRIFPYSEAREGISTDWIGLYLWRTELSVIKIVTFGFYVKKEDGTLCLQKNSTWRFDGNRGYGEPKFLKRSQLLQRKSELLPSGAFTIVCVLKEHSSFQELNTLCTGLENLLVSKRYSDVTIHVGEEVFEAHKNILVATSSVFAAKFENEWSAKDSGTVSIEDCDPKSFKDFLHFLYTGRADITECNVFHLYKTAHKYRVEELMSHCVAFMIDNISIDNVFYVAALGDEYSDENLNNFCSSFFEDNMLESLSLDF